MPLYLKDQDITELVAHLSTELHLSKTEVVRRALARYREETSWEKERAHRLAGMRSISEEARRRGLGPATPEEIDRILGGI